MASCRSQLEKRQEASQLPGFTFEVIEILADPQLPVWQADASRVQEMLVMQLFTW